MRGSAGWIEIVIVILWYANIERKESVGVVHCEGGKRMEEGRMENYLQTRQKRDAYGWIINV